MAKLSRRLLAKTAVRLLREQPANQAKIAQALAAYLVMHKQASQLAALMRDIHRELLATEQSLYAEVVSAFPLEAATRVEIEKYLQSATGARAVQLSESIQPDLLSGIILRTADYELDTSAQYKLKQLVSPRTGGK
jgi:F0F1-type ATP synthase delta subunit